MVSMDPYVHVLWGKAFFGLKWLGVKGIEHNTGSQGNEIEYTLFTVQWYWLSDQIPGSLESYLETPAEATAQRLIRPRQRVRLGGDGELGSLADSLRDSFAHAPARHPTIGIRARDQQGRLIESGRIFTLKVETGDLSRIKTVIDYQWLAVRMASMPGAAQVADDLEKEPPIPFLSLFLRLRHL
jgi:hypothetical protein